MTRAREAEQKLAANYYGFDGFAGFRLGAPLNRGGAGGRRGMLLHFVGADPRGTDARWSQCAKFREKRKPRILKNDQNSTSISRTAVTFSGLTMYVGRLALSEICWFWEYYESLTSCLGGSVRG